MAIKNRVQLITYPDSLGGSLRSLNEVLLKHFKDVFPGGGGGAQHTAVPHDGRSRLGSVDLS